ncbi:MAG TPA: lasso RiPP family leader peptide-containing protein [Solirubrobacteraceae bacterium]|jgi:hypothetical protein|nr:lasso RiPP family leader peptide-containing protein [Solirubrobacteraceae bacterium]
MDEQKIPTAYETPRVVDYGDLQELTASCVGGTGGDSRIPGGALGGYSIGPSTSVCTSKP